MSDDTARSAAEEISSQDVGEDGGDAPPTPRGLLATVIILGVLLVVGFFVVFGTIIYRLVDSDGSARPSARTGFGVSEVLIDPGARVRDVTLVDNRLAVYVTGGAHEEIVLIDVRHGTELGRIRLRSSTDLATAR